MRRLSITASGRGRMMAKGPLAGNSPSMQTLLALKRQSMRGTCAYSSGLA